jgi:chemotaxis protein methyltransferase WspC
VHPYAEKQAKYESPAEMLESAQQFANKGQLTEALKLCEKCLSVNMLDIQANFLMGVISHALDQEKKAEEFFNKTIYLDPNHHEALMHLAFISENKGDRRRAEQLRQRAQRILIRESKF